MAFTGTLIVTANGSVENINGGMRLPMGFVPAWTTTGGQMIPLSTSDLIHETILVDVVGNYMVAVTDSFTLKPGRIYKFEVWGAQGGRSNSIGIGQGGYSIGWYSTVGNTADITAYYYAGGRGVDGTASSSGAGGYNGGGNGGTGTGPSGGGGGGGGASDIRVGSMAPANRVIVAGGTAGAGGGYGGGGGGGVNGDAGPSGVGANSGGGGSQSAGGSAGPLYGAGSTNGGIGSFGTGGNGGNGFAGAGGGGGGWYGGGGGGGGNTSASGGGGGGSGYIGGVDRLINSPASTTANQRVGHGMVRVTEYYLGLSGTVRTSGINTPLDGVTISYERNGIPGTTTTRPDGTYCIEAESGDSVVITNVALARYSLDTTVRPVPTGPYNFNSSNPSYTGVDFSMFPPPIWMEIDLANSDGSLTNSAWSSYYQYSAGTLTIRSDAPVTHTGPVAYRIWQSGSHSVTGIVVNTGVTTSIIIDDITMTGNFDLRGNANVDLLLAGDNSISGSVLVPNRGGTNIATIRIDSATGTGSTGGSLTATATANGNAGIGGASGQSGGSITINGGTVTATGYASGTGSGSAGIGGGYTGSSGTIVINGGMVTATGSSLNNGGACIGGGSMSGAGTITISGGTVIANSPANGASGIGGGWMSGAGTVLINGDAVVTASSASDGAGIGSGSMAGSYGAGTVTITGNAVVTASSSASAPGIGSGLSDFNGVPVTITGNAVVTVISNGTGIGAGVIGGLAPITIDSTATVKVSSCLSGLSSVSALRGSPISGTGYIVNNNIDAAAAYDRDIKIFNAGTINQVNTLTLPANYVCYAYSTGNTAPENFNEFIYNNATGVPLGQIVRVSDNSPIIYSVNTNAVLPVRLQVMYQVTNNIANTALDNTTALQGSNYAGTLTADPGYALPQSITMTR
ncbi:MAG: glycine-rich protein, partial [Methanimicrococcus sp.]|nr:glycine-rich protein [Methanimicrococcus sp.]